MKTASTVRSNNSPYAPVKTTVLAQQASFKGRDWNYGNACAVADQVCKIFNYGIGEACKYSFAKACSDLLTAASPLDRSTCNGLSPYVKSAFNTMLAAKEVRAYINLALLTVELHKFFAKGLLGEEGVFKPYKDNSGKAQTGLTAYLTTKNGNQLAFLAFSGCYAAWWLLDVKKTMPFLESASANAIHFFIGSLFAVMIVDTTTTLINWNKDLDKASRSEKVANLATNSLDLISCGIESLIGYQFLSASDSLSSSFFSFPAWGVMCALSATSGAIGLWKAYPKVATAPETTAAEASAPVTSPRGKKQRPKQA